jgi:NTE family protein
MSAMTKVGLVLGAGGIVGQAYEAGVLAALAHDLGWDPRTAEIIVGSSAGSVTGALLRLGVPADDLAAFTVEAPLLSLEAQHVLERIGAEPPSFPKLELRDLTRGWRLPSPALLARTIRRPLAFRPTAAAATLMPRGKVDIAGRAAVLDAVAGEHWPDGLWICIARRSDGHRVVLGREGSPEATLAQGVAASCAIPGYFAPVRIEGVQYIDGGVHSPTNADVLKRSGLDLVIVVSPMSAVRGKARGPNAAFRWSTHRRLADEVRQLKRAGTEVVRFEPGARSLAAMGMNAMAEDRSAPVVQAAFFEAGRHAGHPKVVDRLAPIATRSTSQRIES